METKRDYIDFLKEAIEASRDTKALENLTHKKEIEFKELSKEYDSESEAVQDNIDSTIKKRKNELVKSFDAEIDKADDMLKKTQHQRGKAKASGQKVRIAEETASLRDEVRRYNNQNATLFKQSGIPGYCNSRIFFALTSPTGLMDVLICLICFAVLFILVPFLIVTITGLEGILMVLVYALIVAVVGFIYYVFFLRIRINHADTIKQARGLRKRINADIKQINAIKQNILHDRNEKMYDLEGFDEQIDNIEADISEVGRKKQEALNKFEKDTKVRIIDEITENNQERLDELKTKSNQAKQDYDEYFDKLKQQKLILASKYETVLGKDYSEDEVETYISYLEHGQATNITEAQNLYKIGAKVGFDD